MVDRRKIKEWQKKARESGEDARRKSVEFKNDFEEMKSEVARLSVVLYKVQDDIVAIKQELKDLSKNP